MINSSLDSILSVNISSLCRGGARVLADIHFTLGRGERLAVVGPNGSGKTSLLAAITRQLKPASGDICLLGTPISALSAAQRARHVALLGQNEAPDPRLTLEDYVALGRLPHLSAMSPREHRAVVLRSLKETGLYSFRHRTLGALSGGERQRAALARVFAQTPDLLLLDEPTNHLDPAGRAELLAQVKSKGIATVAVLHDLPLAEAFAERMLVLCQGRQIVWDVPEKALAAEYLYPVFGLTSVTVAHPNTGKTLRIYETPCLA